MLALVERERQIIAGLSTVGLMISAYLWYSQHSASLSMMCTTGCGEVLNSAYGYIAGIPISVLGIVFYLSLLILNSVMPLPTQRKLLLINLTLGVGVLFTIYLRYLEFFRIHKICQWCWGSAVIVFVLAFIRVMAIVNGYRDSGTDREELSL